MSFTLSAGPHRKEVIIIDMNEYDGTSSGALDVT